jgi:Tfp pilus assembly PilM family ATPase
MFTSTPKQVLGLDVGQAAVKAVVLARHRGGVRVVDHAVLDLRAEGILDESELWEQLGDWLEQCRFDGFETVSGIPQYFATTQVNDFPANDADNLERMVEYETQHLAGLSDESFLHNHTVMPGAGDKLNPVLIGVCRSAIAEERYESLRDCGVRVSDIGLNGAAFASACIDLAPPQQPETLTLALDVGSENTTMVILRNRTALQIVSVPVGMDEESPTLSYGTTASYSTRVAKAHRAVERVCSETQVALDHWREQNEVKRTSPDRILLSGGGAKSISLQTALNKQFGCSVKSIGLQAGEPTASNPELVTAYGLALQGLGCGAFPLSMMIPKARNALRRRRLFKYVVLAALLLTGLIIYHEASLFLSVENRAERIREELDNIEQCQRFVPDLESLSRQKTMLRRSVVPVAVQAMAGPRYIQTIQALVEACQTVSRHPENPKLPNVWVIYLADTQTFSKRKALSEPDQETSVRSAPRTPSPRTSRMPVPASGVVEDGDPESKESAFALFSAGDVTGVSGMIAAVMTPTRESEPFKYVSQLIRLLDESPDFSRVDLLPQQDQAELGDVFVPWTKALLSTGIRDSRGFMIRIPFANEVGGRQ